MFLQCKLCIGFRKILGNPRMLSYGMILGETGGGHGDKSSRALLALNLVGLFFVSLESVFNGQ